MATHELLRAEYESTLSRVRQRRLLKSKDLELVGQLSVLELRLPLDWVGRNFGLELGVVDFDRLCFFELLARKCVVVVHVEGGRFLAGQQHIVESLMCVALLKLTPLVDARSASRVRLRALAIGIVLTEPVV